MSEKRFSNVFVCIDGNIEIMLKDKKEEFLYEAVSPLVERLLNYLDVEIKKLKKENQQLRKIGVMYQRHNPCETCTYCLEDKLCCAEPIPIYCDDAKKNFIQGLCKKHKQFMKSIRRYDDE